MPVSILVDLAIKDPPLIKAVKAELVELVIALSLRRCSSVSIYCLHPDTHQCIYPASEKLRSLNSDLSLLNEARLTEESDLSFDEQQALAAISVRALFAERPDARLLILTNCVARWTTSTLDFARNRITVQSAGDRVTVKRLLHGILEDVAPLRLEAVLAFPSDENCSPPVSEIRLTLTPAISLPQTMELRQSRISLYVADVLVTSSVETQLCFGTAWLGVAEEPMAITALADLQGKGLSVLCSSAFHCETFEVRPYPCYYVCIPAEVGEGSLLLVQVAVRECLRCIDRPDISCSLQRDSRLSEWLQRKFPAKLFNPLDYSNHFYEYTAGQCLGASRATAPQKPETKAEVSRPMNTLDKLASMFENVSAGRRSKKAGRSG